jgi:hypothetical protein
MRFPAQLLPPQRLVRRHAKRLCHGFQTKTMFLLFPEIKRGFDCTVHPHLVKQPQHEFKANAHKSTDHLGGSSRRVRMFCPLLYPPNGPTHFVQQGCWLDAFRLTWDPLETISIKLGRAGLHGPAGGPMRAVDLCGRAAYAGGHWVSTTPWMARSALRWAHRVRGPLIPWV